MLLVFMRNLFRKDYIVPTMAIAFTTLFLLGCETIAPTILPFPESIETASDHSPASEPAQKPSMVLIPAGTYLMGSEESDDTLPVHEVTLQAFEIDRYEVTNAQYAEFLNSLAHQPLKNAPAGGVRPTDLPKSAIPLFIEGAGGDPRQTLIALDDEHSRIALVNGRFLAEPNYEQHPVTETTWLGAKQFCEWRGARLPTEAEWEIAARGTDERLFPWGNEMLTPDRAVYGRGSGGTAPVGVHPAGATATGIQDMAGNVAEWTSSLYRPYPYNPDDGRENPIDRGERVTRGGDHVFDSDPEELTTFFRKGFSRAPDRGHRHIGFRCAHNVR